MTVSRDDDTSISLANSEDFEVIHRLLSELERALDVKGSVRRKASDILRFGFSDQPLFEALIARKGDHPVGLALYFREFSTWRGSPGVYVQDLYVSSDIQGRGLGRRLMESVLNRSRTWGATYCKLSVYGQNEKALTFYRRLGFQVSKDERVLIRDFA
jgi:GNAT superfamily N-acetyltransferase